MRTVVVFTALLGLSVAARLDHLLHHHDDHHDDHHDNHDLHDSHNTHHDDHHDSHDLNDAHEHNDHQSDHKNDHNDNQKDPIDHKNDPSDHQSDHNDHQSDHNDHHTTEERLNILTESLSHQEHAVLRGQRAEGVAGAYSWTAPNGQIFTVEYVADDRDVRKNGNVVKPSVTSSPAGLLVVGGGGGGESSGSSTNFGGRRPSGVIKLDVVDGVVGLDQDAYSTPSSDISALNSLQRQSSNIVSASSQEGQVRRKVSANNSHHGSSTITSSAGQGTTTLSGVSKSGGNAVSSGGSLSNTNTHYNKQGLQFPTGSSHRSSGQTGSNVAVILAGGTGGTGIPTTVTHTQAKLQPLTASGVGNGQVTSSRDTATSLSGTSSDSNTNIHSVLSSGTFTSQSTSQHSGTSTTHSQFGSSDQHSSSPSSNPGSTSSVDRNNVPVILAGQDTSTGNTHSQSYLQTFGDTTANNFGSRSESQLNSFRGTSQGRPNQYQVTTSQDRPNQFQVTTSQGRPTQVTTSQARPTQVSTSSGSRFSSNTNSGSRFSSNTNSGSGSRLSTKQTDGSVSVILAGLNIPPTVTTGQLPTVTTGSGVGVRDGVAVILAGGQGVTTGLTHSHTSVQDTDVTVTNNNNSPHSSGANFGFQSSSLSNDNSKVSSESFSSQSSTSGQHSESFGSQSQGDCSNLHSQTSSHSSSDSSNSQFGGSGDVGQSSTSVSTPGQQTLQTLTGTGHDSPSNSFSGVKSQSVVSDVQTSGSQTALENNRRNVDRTTTTTTIGGVNSQSSLSSGSKFSSASTTSSNTGSAGENVAVILANQGVVTGVHRVQPTTTTTTKVGSNLGSLGSRGSSIQSQFTSSVGTPSVSTNVGSDSASLPSHFQPPSASRFPTTGQFVSNVQGGTNSHQSGSQVLGFSGRPLPSKHSSSHASQSDTTKVSAHQTEGGIAVILAGQNGFSGVGLGQTQTQTPHGSQVAAVGISNESVVGSMGSFSTQQTGQESTSSSIIGVGGDTKATDGGVVVIPPGETTLRICSHTSGSSTADEKTHRTSTSSGSTLSSTGSTSSSFGSQFVPIPVQRTPSNIPPVKGSSTKLSQKPNLGSLVIGSQTPSTSSGSQLTSSQNSGSFTGQTGSNVAVILAGGAGGTGIPTTVTHTQATLQPLTASGVGNGQVTSSRDTATSLSGTSSDSNTNIHSVLSSGTFTSQHSGTSTTHSQFGSSDQHSSSPSSNPGSTSSVDRNNVPVILAGQDTSTGNTHSQSYLHTTANNFGGSHSDFTGSSGSRSESQLNSFRGTSQGRPNQYQVTTSQARPNQFQVTSQDRPNQYQVTSQDRPNQVSTSSGSRFSSNTNSGSRFSSNTNSGSGSRLSTKQTDGSVPVILAGLNIPPTVTTGSGVGVRDGVAVILAGGQGVTTGVTHSHTSVPHSIPSRPSITNPRITPVISPLSQGHSSVTGSSHTSDNVREVSAVSVVTLDNTNQNNGQNTDNNYQSLYSSKLPSTSEHSLHSDQGASSVSSLGLNGDGGGVTGGIGGGVTGGGGGGGGVGGGGGSISVILAGHSIPSGVTRAQSSFQTSAAGANGGTSGSNNGVGQTVLGSQTNAAKTGVSPGVSSVGLSAPQSSGSHSGGSFGTGSQSYSSTSHSTSSGFAHSSSSSSVSGGDGRVPATSSQGHTTSFQTFGTHGEFSTDLQPPVNTQNENTQNDHNQGQWVKAISAENSYDSPSQDSPSTGSRFSLVISQAGNTKYPVAGTRLSSGLSSSASGNSGASVSSSSSSKPRFSSTQGIKNVAVILARPGQFSTG
ncbi:hypothetical protein Pcinc_042788 [Petrolisthes cinctipes]|uniref:Uncharacterized protein n=1 Tax=Petrolisthes cinctipes TaxID=88211 RepID=A0AAE1BGZ4_PETCI|nr:hypothetical protein Pcinc_042788 [Petrolisthes cinctipes]